MQKLELTKYKFDLYSPRVFKEIIFFDSGAEEEPDSGDINPEENAGDLVEETKIAAAGLNIIAVLAAALLAVGFLEIGGVIRAVRPESHGAAWKKAGIRDLMQRRDLRSFR